MPRPAEYDNLIKTRAFEPVAPAPGALEGFLGNAADYKTTAEGLGSKLPMQVFTLAYEDYFQHVLRFPISSRIEGRGRNHAGDLEEVFACRAYADWQGVRSETD